MTCTYHNPASRTAVPSNTATVSARSAGSFFLSWSKISTTVSSGSLSSAFDLAVRAERHFAPRAVIHGAMDSVEEPEPQRRDRGADRGREDPLPERKPTDERLGLRVKEEKQ